jgi:hypothetical protein
VAAPEPLELVELPDASGALRGVEAVVDKDLTSALLAGAVDTDVLLAADRRRCRDRRLRHA